MMSIPTTLPSGAVRSTATCDHEPGANPRSTITWPALRRKSRYLESSSRSLKAARDLRPWTFASRV